MQAHMELAILDHNYNTNRKQAINKKAMLTFRSLVCEGIKYAKQKHFGCKKVQGQSEATVKYKLYM